MSAPLPHEMPTAPPWTVTRAHIEAAAAAIGAGARELEAVFRVEAPGGQAFDAAGILIRRFEPHHFPKQLWGAIGFAPGAVTPWRASLDLSTSLRERMLRAACAIDLEAAYRATSWGAGQIMGFNHRDCGYPSAVAMVRRHVEDGPAESVAVFARLVQAWQLAPALRARDWAAIARRWNGPANVAAYSERLARAWARLDDGPWPDDGRPVLRSGSRGAAVRELQQVLAARGFALAIDGDFGPATERAVRAWQESCGLDVDGIVGVFTWAALLDDPELAPISAPLPPERPGSQRPLPGWLDRLVRFVQTLW